jgi:cytochrome c oxidase assembly factor CtaG
VVTPLAVLGTPSGSIDAALAAASALRRMAYVLAQRNGP